MRLLYDRTALSPSTLRHPRQVDMEDTQQGRGKMFCLEGCVRPAASAGDSRETDIAASTQLVEPSGHKPIMDFFSSASSELEAHNKLLLVSQ